MKYLLLTGCMALCLFGCGGGGDGGTVFSAPTPVVTASPGGYWIGADTELEPVVMLVSELGDFHVFRWLFDRSVGTLSVNESDTVNGALGISGMPGGQSSSGLTDCKLTGSVNERVSMLLDVRCRNTQDQEVLTTLSVEYDTRYDRESSLSTIAGNYRFDIGNVFNITGDGQIFSQEGQAGCITLGDVWLIDDRFNAYEIELIFIECPGVDRTLYYETLTGLAMLDNTVTPERLIYSVSGETENNFVVISGWADRL